MEHSKLRVFIFAAIAVMTVLILQFPILALPLESISSLSKVLVLFLLAALICVYLGLRRKRRGAILNQPLPVRAQLMLFALFIASFCAFWCVMYLRVLPSKFTYDLAFSPVVITGYSYFITLCVQSRFNSRILGRLLLTFFAMLLLANFVDIMLMKLGTWIFSSKTHWLAFDLPYPFNFDVHGNPIKMPVMEAFGFNGCITWFILYCLSLLERFVDPEGAKKGEHYRPAAQ